MTNELKRWTDDPQETQLPELYREAAAAYPRIAPEEQRLEAVLRGLEAAANVDGGGGAKLGLKGWALLGGALMVISGIGGLLWAGAGPQDAAQRSAAEVVRPTASTEPAVTAAAPAGTQEPVQAAADAADAGRPESAQSVPAKAQRAKAPAGAAADPLAELELLRRAQRVLVAQPERALALTQEHQRLYQHGMLEQERELLAVEALIALGRRAQAEQRAARFEREHPNSMHSHRLGVILGR